MPGYTLYTHYDMGGPKWAAFKVSGPSGPFGPLVGHLQCEVCSRYDSS